MKIKLVGSVVLATLMMAGCSNNAVVDSTKKVSYAGNYHILTDGSCDLQDSNTVKTKMPFNIEKVEGENTYISKLPEFDNSPIPSTSSKVELDNNGLVLFFDKAEKPNPDIAVNVSIELQPHPTANDTLLITKFNMYKNEKGKEENRDFVQWFINKLDLSEQEKSNIKGLCAVKSV